MLASGVSCSRMWQQKFFFDNVQFYFFGRSDWQNCILSKWVWLASWDQITVSVQRTGSSSQLGMKHNCVYLVLGDKRIANLYFVLRTNAWAVPWVLWTSQSELQKQKSFMLVQGRKMQWQELLWEITLQSSAPNPLSHINESGFSTLPQWKP